MRGERRQMEDEAAVGKCTSSRDGRQRVFQTGKAAQAKAPRQEVAW